MLAKHATLNSQHAFPCFSPFFCVLYPLSEKDGTFTGRNLRMACACHAQTQATACERTRLQPRAFCSCWKRGPTWPGRSWSSTHPRRLYSTVYYKLSEVPQSVPPVRRYYRPIRRYSCIYSRYNVLYTVGIVQVQYNNAVLVYEYCRRFVRADPLFRDSFGYANILQIICGRHTHQMVILPPSDGTRIKVISYRDCGTLAKRTDSG